MSVEELDLPRDKFECVCIMPIELDAMRTEFSISFQDIDGPCEIKTCYGDICKIVNALMDYSRMLEMVCDHWHLEGFHRATYEYHAEKLRAIARKYQASIHYDYDAAVEKCQKKRAKNQKDDDVGGEAMEMAYRKSLRTAAKTEPADDSASGKKSSS